LLVFLVNHVL